MYLPPISLRALRLVRGLRFRLAATYLTFFTLLLVLIGVFVRQQLNDILDRRVRDVLNEEWGAVQGYMRIEKGAIKWFYDRDDPEESLIVENLQKVFYVSDPSQKLQWCSDTYHSLGCDSKEQIAQVLASKEKSIWSRRRSEDGEWFLVRAGRLSESLSHQPYFLAIGHSLTENQQIDQEFTRTYFTLFPFLVVLTGVFGWFMAGRVLRPVNDVARTAERISSSNLSSQIPPRGANDELDHLIKSFNRMISRLSASFTQTRQFSTDVSHELRTPLTVIRGQLEVALLTAQSTDQYRDAILEALQDVDRLSQTIRALLLLSQAESGQLLLQKSSLDFAALVRDIVEQYQIPAEGANVKLIADLPEECYLSGDRLQLERLLYNLLSNGVKYTPAGGRVLVTLECLDEMATLRVSDTGVGIPKESLPHIFDRFYRVPSNAKDHPEKGLGLGLSFVAWIVKAHGGTIEVTSEPGNGTTFSVSLPREDAAPTAAIRQTGYTGERSS